MKKILVSFVSLLAAITSINAASAVTMVVEQTFDTTSTPCDCSGGQGTSTSCRVSDAFMETTKISFGNILQVETSCTCTTRNDTASNAGTKSRADAGTKAAGAPADVVHDDAARATSIMTLRSKIVIQPTDPSFTVDSGTAFEPLLQVTSPISNSIADNLNFVIPDDNISVSFADGSAFVSSQVFDSTSRKFCIHVMNFRINSRLRMRPCITDPKKSSKRKQEWKIDSKGRMQNSTRDQWCVTWAGGKKRELRLDLCANSARKTTEFKYDANQTAIVVKNVLNGKRLLFGHGLKEKYLNIRLLPFNT